MESRTQDLETVSRLRSARMSVVSLAQRGDLNAIFNPDLLSPESQAYVVKLLDVYPPLGKVAGRRLMAQCGIAPLARIADLSTEQRRALQNAVEGRHD